MHRWLNLLRKVGMNFDWIAAVICSFIFSILGILGVFLPQITFSATLCVLGILSVGAFRDRITSEKRNETTNELMAHTATLLQSNQLLSDGMYTGISRVFPKAVDFNWITYINEAKHVTIVGIKPGYKGAYIDSLEAVLDRGGTVTLVMADPRSPRLWLRYQEERTLQRSRAGAAEDLARVAFRLNEWRQHLITEGHNTSRLSIRVFQNYPTTAYYKLDDNIFTYNYPYQQLGYNGPLFLFTDPKTPVHLFLEKSIEYLVASSLPIEDVIEDIQKKYNAQYFSDKEVFQSKIVVEPR